jgi:hypothetical protein
VDATGCQPGSTGVGDGVRRKRAWSFTKGSAGAPQSTPTRLGGGAARTPARKRSTSFNGMHPSPSDGRSGGGVDGSSSSSSSGDVHLPRTGSANGGGRGSGGGRGMGMIGAASGSSSARGTVGSGGGGDQHLLSEAVRLHKAKMRELAQREARARADSEQATYKAAVAEAEACAAADELAMAELDPLDGYGTLLSLAANQPPPPPSPIATKRSDPLDECSARIATDVCCSRSVFGTDTCCCRSEAQHSMCNQ